MADIKDIAVASWKLEKWLDNLNVERKMAAKSALRSMKKYLSDNHVETLDLTGSKYDSGLAINVVNNEAPEVDENDLLISEMVKPIIMQDGAVIEFGQVILNTEVKKQKPNNAQVDSNPILKDQAIAKQEDTTGNKEVLTEEEKVTLESTGNFEHGKTRNTLPIIIGIIILAFEIITLVIVLKGQQKENVQKETIPQKVESSIDYSEQINGLDDKIDVNFKQLSNEISSLKDDLGDVSKKIDSMETDNTETTSAASPLDELNKMKQYVVESGDTLIKICAKNNLDYQKYRVDIITINHIDDPDKLNVGDVIYLPISE